MIVRTASCPCGQLQARCEGEPVRISVCHCLNCKQRSGSAFAVQARWPAAQVAISGDRHSWQRAGDEGSVATFSFCPTCGTTVTYTNDAMPGWIAVAVGTFADPDFPAPMISVYENRQHAWLEIKGTTEELG